MYNILESKIEFKNNQLQKITVLVDCSNDAKPLTDVRVIYATTEKTYGYMIIPPNATLNEELLQKVAAFGSQDYNRDKIFPNWKSNLKK